MLKKELIAALEDARRSLDDFASDRARLMRDADKKDKEIENLQEGLRYTSDQMKQISQSIYTMLQVKYPDMHTMEPVDEGEDKRFLMFLHGLCEDRNYNVDSVDDVFRAMSR